MLKLPLTQAHPCGMGLHPLQDLPKKARCMGRTSLLKVLQHKTSSAPHTEQPGCLPHWVPIRGTAGVWLVHGVAGFACAATCRGDGRRCVLGAGRGVTLLAAWAAPACAGMARGEGRTEEFAIWASLLLSCCYGTAAMLPGRRWWPAFVTPGLP